MGVGDHILSLFEFWLSNLWLLRCFMFLKVSISRLRRFYCHSRPVCFYRWIAVWHPGLQDKQVRPRHHCPLGLRRAHARFLPRLHQPAWRLAYQSVCRAHPHCSQVCTPVNLCCLLWIALFIKFNCQCLIMYMCALMLSTIFLLPWMLNKLVVLVLVYWCISSIFLVCWRISCSVHYELSSNISILYTEIYKVTWHFGNAIIAVQLQYNGKWKSL